ncbi:MAG: plasmid pRiA4b ORF-3 family protein [Desulfobacterales bacterium]|nr:plasmid pRiA4b ORF-3 family protein [Desulfobacterales bacterium]
MKKDSNLIKLLSPSVEKEQILRNQVVDENGPGTILRDFEIVLGFIGTKGIKVSARHGFFPLKSLSELNAQLTHPIEINLKRPQQKSYPYINGLYLLLRATGLTITEGSGTKHVLVLDNTVLQSWRDLNPTERYFTLLETWLLKGAPEILGEHGGGFFDSPITKWTYFFRDIPDRGLRIAGDKDREQLINYSPGLHNVALLDLFELISVQHAKPEKGKGWRIARVHRTPFGNALLPVLSGYFRSEEYYLNLGSEKDVAFGQLQPIVQPYFSEWRKNLVIPEPEFQDGVYVFKASLGSVWRRIAIPGQMDFDILSSTILNAFDFDHDHLYEFSYKNRMGILNRINHPYTDEPPFTDEVLIGDLALKPGTVITYLFDFGDMWEFDVKLERIDPLDHKMKKPVILETRGEAPEQYPTWDEE